MSYEVEEIPEAKLLVVRQVIDPVLAETFQQEMLTRFFRYSSDITRVDSTGYSVSHLIDDDRFPTTHKVLAELGLSHMYMDTSLTINHQPPHTVQEFHRDNPVEDNTVAILHGGNGGFFDCHADYDVEDEEVGYIRTPAHKGDLFIQYRPYHLHRGVNESDQPRVTVAFAVPIDDFGWGDSR